MTSDVRVALVALLLAAAVTAGSALAGARLRISGDLAVQPIRVGTQISPALEPARTTPPAPAPAQGPVPRSAPAPARTSSPAPASPALPALQAPVVPPVVAPAPPTEPQERTIPVDRDVYSRNTGDYEDKHGDDAEPDEH